VTDGRVETAERATPIRLETLRKSRNAEVTDRSIPTVEAPGWRLPCTSWDMPRANARVL